MPERPIPVSAAADIAEDYEYDQVIIVAWNAETGRTHVTTFGTEGHKRMAAQGGDRIAKCLGLEDVTVHEDAEGLLKR